MVRVEWFAALIAEALREAAVKDGLVGGCLVDAKDLNDAVIDGHVDLVKAAEMMLDRIAG